MALLRASKTYNIYKVVLAAIVVVLLLSMLLFGIFTIYSVYRRIDSNTSDLLDRSLVVAWEEYNNFFNSSGAMLATISRLEPTRNYFAVPSTLPETLSLINESGELDLWLAVDCNGNVLGGTYENIQVPDLFLQAISPSWDQGDPLLLSELLPSEIFCLVDPLFKPRFMVAADGGREELFPWALVQVVAEPVKETGSGFNLGCLVGMKILNADQTIASGYSEQVPGSYLSIGVAGMRISSNIKAFGNSEYVGLHQSKELYETIQKGERFTGEAIINPRETHFVTSEKITNSAGEIIGALSVGVPAQGLPNIKRDILCGISLALAICLSVALLVASFVSKKVSQPLVSFVNMARDLSHNQELIGPEQLRWLEGEQHSFIEEISRLHDAFYRMGQIVYQKSCETEQYNAALESDRRKLQSLTEELKKANMFLEKKVDERTCELRAAVVELKSLNKLKTQFLANMSHELRTPLNSIIGFSEILADETFGRLNNTQQEYVQIILSSARHLLQLLSDILDLSRVEQDEILLHKQKINLSELIHSIKAIIKPQLLAKKQKVTINVKSDVPDIYADPTRIKQVIYNLFSNANKFTPEQGKITVVAFYNEFENEVGITVSDNGIGIKKEHQRHVFDQFYQCETLYENKYEGVGLGLPLSKKLVELHGGRIELQSTEGKGTSVTFYLPVLPPGLMLN